jgi:hypothetical protein
VEPRQSASRVRQSRTVWARIGSRNSQGDTGTWLRRLSRLRSGKFDLANRLRHVRQPAALPPPPARDAEPGLLLPFDLRGSVYAGRAKHVCPSRGGPPTARSHEGRAGVVRPGTCGLVNVTPFIARSSVPSSTPPSGSLVSRASTSCSDDPLRKIAVWRNRASHLLLISEHDVRI